MNHAFQCPNRKSFNQQALDKKHAEMEAGTYQQNRRPIGQSLDSVMGGSSSESKTKDQKIEEMSEKRNAAMDRQTDALIEVAIALIYVGDSIRYRADEQWSNYNNLKPLSEVLAESQGESVGDNGNFEG